MYMYKFSPSREEVSWTRWSVTQVQLDSQPCVNDHMYQTITSAATYMDDIYCSRYLSLTSTYNNEASTNQDIPNVIYTSIHSFVASSYIHVLLYR